MKHRLAKDGNELVTHCNQLKLLASDGKQYKIEYMAAMRLIPVNPTKIRALIANALTDKINDREIFMKGIDYSYYYEQDN